MLTGCALAILVIRRATMMFNPSWAGIEVAEDASPGETAIANIYFIVLTPWFFVPSICALVSVVGFVTVHALGSNDGPVW
jgi:hypothetical protein